MHENIGTATQLALAQHAGDLNTGIYTTFTPSIVLVVLVILVLYVGLSILARICEYIIAWIFFRGKDNDE